MNNLKEAQEKGGKLLESMEGKGWELVIRNGGLVGYFYHVKNDILSVVPSGFDGYRVLIGIPEIELNKDFKDPNEAVKALLEFLLNKTQFYKTLYNKINYITNGRIEDDEDAKTT